MSFSLKKLKGYQIGLSSKHDTTINHLFFVDDLKLIAVNLNLLKQQLDLEGYSYKCLGQDENIGYVGPLNKARVTPEYKNAYERSGHVNLPLIINILHIMFLHYQF